MPSENDTPETPVETPPGNQMAEDQDEKYVSKAEYQQMRQEREDALEALRQAVEESDGFKKRIAELEPFEKQASDMTLKARSLEAARTFDKIAKELKIRDEFKDDVFKLGDFKPKDGEEIDEKAVREHFDGFLKDRPQYRENDKEPTKFAKGDGSTRGGPSPAEGDGNAKEKVTRSQLNDGEWMAANSELISDPSKYEIVNA
jgi:hypothetical protein